ncbi:hypothetical protein [Nocardia tengchongensis]|uniref:hypothetical protein n=1 Tax=Nocardia tengchongensis TaxID=2055889 RepID=UPI0036460E41
MRAFARTLAVTTLALGGLLSAPVVQPHPATATPDGSDWVAGSLITTTAQPDGWHQLWGGAAVEYWTTRSTGEPVRASGALFVPAGQPPAGGWPIMAWDHGTTGLGPRCGCQTDPEREVLPYRRREEDAIMRFFLAKGFVSILIGMRAARPDAQVDSYLTDFGRQLLDSVQYDCLGELTDRMAGIAPGSVLSRPLSEGPFPAVLRDYMTVATRGYDAPILLLLNATDITVPSPLHAALAAQLAANGIGFETVVGTGGHTELNPQMWAAMDAFTDRVFAAPTVS